MKKNDFMQIFNQAIIEEKDFVITVILTKGSDAPEFIINPNVNFQNKKEYYDKAYNEEMILNTYDGIKIIDCYAGTIEEIPKLIENFENIRKSFNIPDDWSWV